MKKRLLPLALLSVISLSSCNFVNELLSDALNNSQESEQETEIVSVLGEPIDSKYNVDAISQKVSQLKDDKGLYIEFEISSPSGDDTLEIETYKLGANKDKYYFALGENEEIYDLTSDTQAIIYTKYGDNFEKEVVEYDSGYTSKESMKTIVNGYYESIFQYMSHYQNYASFGYLKSDATVIDRACDKYSLVDYIVGYSFKFNYYIDKETGFCLKMDFEEEDGPSRNKTTFECKQLLMEYEVEIPNVGEEE